MSIFHIYVYGIGDMNACELKSLYFYEIVTQK